MAVALEGIDLVALAAVMVLLGLTLAAQYTFQVLADRINVGILGTHPFAGVSRTIEGTIVHWCAVGAKALEGVANTLWRGLTWSISATLQTIMAIPRDVHNAIAYLKDHKIAQLVVAALIPYGLAVKALDAAFNAFRREISSDVTRLDAKIQSTALATVHTIERELGTEVKRVEGEISTGLHGLRTTLEAQIATATHAAEASGAEALSKLRTAENAAIGAIERAEGATAAELRDFIKDVPLTDIGAALAALPLVIAAVNILEAETGLGRAECRSKIKGICGTDPRQWAKLLGGLALMDVAFNFRELAEAAIAMVRIAEPEIKAIVRG